MTDAQSYVADLNRRAALANAAMVRARFRFNLAFIGCCLIGFGIGCLAAYIYYF